MNHKKIQDMLAIYDALSSGERSMIDAHIRTCPDCARLLEAYRHQDASIRLLSDPRPNPQFATQFVTQIHESVIRPPVKQDFFLTPWLRFGKGVLATGGIVLVVGFLALLLALRTNVSKSIKTGGLSQPPLRDVSFQFDMANCRPGFSGWDAENGLTIRLSRVAVSSSERTPGQSWLVEGHYELHGGRFRAFVTPHFSGEASYAPPGEFYLQPPGGDFRQLFRLASIDGIVHSEDLILQIENQENGQRLRCPIDIQDARPEQRYLGKWATSPKQEDRRGEGAAPPAPTPDSASARSSLYVAWAKKHAPGFVEWFERKSWFHLPDTVPWVGRMTAAGRVTHGIVTLGFFETYADGVDAVNLVWHSSTTHDPSPDDFIPQLRESNLLSNLDAPLQKAGTCIMDGWSCQRYRQAAAFARGEDAIWLIWRDEKAGLDYALILSDKATQVQEAFLQSFHASNPAQLDASALDVSSWNSARTWIPPWLLDGLEEMRFDFDMAHCVHDADGWNDANMPELNLTTVKASPVGDQWFVQGVYTLTTEADALSISIITGNEEPSDYMIFGSPFLVPQKRTFQFYEYLPGVSDAAQPQHLRLHLYDNSNPDYSLYCPIQILDSPASK